MWTRRKLLTGAAGLTAGISGVAPFSILRATAQASEVKLALIAPLSGPWARDGGLMRKGAEMAVDDINQAGGIKSLGGAKIQLIVADTGDTPEKAKNAAQRLVAQEPTLIGGSTGQLSSFGLAITEVTERASMPWLTWSYADQFTSRGFKYMFKTSIDASKISATALPVLLDLAKNATGKRPTTAAIIADDTPASQGAAKAFVGVLAAQNIEVVVNETFTPPISDATPIVQRVRSRKPDLILLLPAAAAGDVVQFINKFVEFKIDIATIAVGNVIASPDMLNLIDGALIEKQMTIASNWTGKASRDVAQRFAQKYNEKWMTEGAISSYGDMWVLKEGLERAGKADRDAVADAIRKLDMTDGPARYYIGGRLKFDEKGQRVGAGIVIVQWLGGEVKTVYPSEAATAEPVWPKS